MSTGTQEEQGGMARDVHGNPGGAGRNGQRCPWEPRRSREDRLNRLNASGQRLKPEHICHVHTPQQTDTRGSVSPT